MTIFKKVLIIIVGIYLSLGFSMGVYFYVQELKNFECVRPNEPHGYIGIGTDSFFNPDSDLCTRRGFTLRSLSIIPLLIAFGVPLATAKYYYGN